MNIEIAKTLTKGAILHHVTMKNGDGSPKRCRVNGKVKLWKREPERFELPVKQGLNNFGYVTDLNQNAWVVA